MKFKNKVTNKMHGNTNKIYAKGNCGGYTLVELIVAAAVLMVVIITLMGTVRYVRKEQTADYHRRQARAVITRLFESTFSTYQKGGEYTLPDQLAPENADQKINVNENVVRRPIAFKDGQEFTIDDRFGGEPCLARMYVTMKTEDMPITDGATSSTTINVNTHLVLLEVEWDELDGTPESVKMEKRLVDKLWIGN